MNAHQLTFVCISRSSSLNHLRHHRWPPARTQIQRQRLRASRSGTAEPHPDHLPDHRWEKSSSFLITICSGQSNIAIIFYEKTWHDWFQLFSIPQLLTRLLGMQSMMWERSPSKSAGPGLRLPLLVRILSCRWACHAVEILFIPAASDCVFVPARLPCGVHTIAGRQQHRAEPARVRDLSDPGGPSPRSPLQHQHLRCGGGTREWTCFCAGHYRWVSSTRYTFLNRC